MCTKSTFRAEVAAEKAKKELVVTNETKTKEITTKDVVAPVLAGDTVQLASCKKSLGFLLTQQHWLQLKSYTTIENKLVTLKLLIKVDISSATLKNYERFKRLG
jgi:YidC/Oxa1 family membrane protein insertase